MDFEFLIFQSFTGVSMGATLFLLAAGLSLVFGVVDVVNFAHASFYMLAAYICYSVTSYFGEGSGYWISLLVAPIIVGFLGGVSERYLFSRVYGRGHYPQIVIAWGLILILNDVFKLVWGTEQKLVDLPDVFNGGFFVLGGIFPRTQMFGVVVAATMALGLFLFLNKTKTGNIVRATAADPEITESLGVNVRGLNTVVFAFACWLGGLGGVVASLQQPASLGGDMEIMLTAFIIVIVGGMGSIMGSLAGSLIVGLVNAWGILILPRFALVFLYVLMVVILVFRPQGLFGQTESK